MNATRLRNAARPTSFPVRCVVRVDGAACTVNAATVWPIADVLDYEQHLDGVITGTIPSADGSHPIATPELVADLLDSRMIAAPRPRRRRERAVSSRAMFYAS